MIFLTTVPKTGLHLMRHILGMGEIRLRGALMSHVINDIGQLQHCRIYPSGISGHIEYHRRFADFAKYLPSFTLLRDPRDVIVSAYHYVDVVPKGHPFLRIQGSDALYSNYRGEDRMDLLIESCWKIFNPYLPWLETNIIPVRYEDLLENTVQALVPVAEATGYDLSMMVERAAYRGGLTFRKGVAGEWRHEFNDRQVARFNKLYGHIMEAWGYALGS